MRPVPRVAVRAAGASLVLALAGCGGDGGDDRAAEAGTTAPPAATARTRQPATAAAPSPAPPPRPRPAPLPGLPRDIAGFQAWERLNDEPIPPDSPQTRRVGFDAHRGTKQVYVNGSLARLTRRSGEQRFPYPDGTVLVKAAREGDLVRLVAIMRKIRGVDPSHGDWEFVEYKRSRAGERFATDASLTGETCTSCHVIARDTDWVFTPLAR